MTTAVIVIVVVAFVALDAFILYWVSTGVGFARTVIGTIEVTQSGAYTLTARNQLPDAVEPKLLVGR